MPAIVASHLGVKGVVVYECEGDRIAGKRVREFEKAPRGGLSTFARLGSKRGDWLRTRNTLLKNAVEGGIEKTRILVCENGACKEEDEVFFVDSGLGGLEGENTKGEIGIQELKGALPNTGLGNAASATATKADAQKENLKLTDLMPSSTG